MQALVHDLPLHPVVTSKTLTASEQFVLPQTQPWLVCVKDVPATELS